MNLRTERLKRYSKEVGASLFGLMMIGIGWHGNELFSQKGTSRTRKAVAPPSVAVSKTKAIAFNPPVEYVGHVEPVQEVDILPHIDGYVQEVCFKEGARVSVGDVLFKIDSEQYLAALNLKKSNVQSAEAKVLVAQAEVDRAERYFKRLNEADDRGVTATDRDTAETTLASARAALASAVASVAEAQASLSIAEFNLKHTVIRSPITGRIGKALHHVGDYVSPSKAPLARVVQMDPVRVVFPIPDRDYELWQKVAERGGREVADSRRLRLVLPDGTYYGNSGRIEFGDNEMSRETATIVMHVSFPNHENRLLPNAFVKVVADESEPEVVTVVPSSALVKEVAGWSVWVIAEGNLAERRAVEPGAVWNGHTVVKKGLEVDECVVTQGTHKVKDGCLVKIVKTTELIEDQTE